MSVSAPALSPPFANREFNGEVLLAELTQLRAAQVPVGRLSEAHLALRESERVELASWPTHLRNIAVTRLSGAPAVAGLVAMWVGRVKSNEDRRAVIEHFERLAVTAAILSAVREVASPGGAW